MKELNEKKKKMNKMANEIDESGNVFSWQELLLEEQRKDKKLIYDLDEKEWKEKLQNSLFFFLENSTNLTNIFETIVVT